MCNAKPCHEAKEQAVSAAGDSDDAKRLAHIYNLLGSSFCPDCPSVGRWAREMMVERAAMLAGEPMPNHEQRVSVNVSLIDVVPPGKLAKARSYLKAKIPHVLGIRADRKLAAGRKYQCTQRENGGPCHALVEHEGGLFCKACGCGARRDANLAIKTKMLFATCTLGYWPDMPGLIRRAWRRMTRLIWRAK